jgi:hypothetical protein
MVMKNMARGKYGKDHPENFIPGALTGGHGPSEGIGDMPVDRPQQSIKTAWALDNVKLAMDVQTSICDPKFAGAVDNVKHSLTGSSAVNEEVGAAGPVRHVIIPNH